MADESTNSDKSEQALLVTQILKAVHSIHYGHVQITVHDSKIVQIEKTEKFRFDGQNSSKSKGGGYKEL